MIKYTAYLNILLLISLTSCVTQRIHTKNSLVYIKALTNQAFFEDEQLAFFTELIAKTLCGNSEKDDMIYISRSCHIRSWRKQVYLLSPAYFVHDSKFNPYGEVELQEEFLGLKFDNVIPKEYQEKYHLFEDRNGLDLIKSNKTVVLFSPLIPTENKDIYFQQYFYYCPENEQGHNEVFYFEFWYEFEGNKIINKKSGTVSVFDLPDE